MPADEGIDQRRLIMEFMAQLAAKKPVNVLGNIEEQQAGAQDRAQAVRSRPLESFRGMDLEALAGGQAAKQRGVTVESIREMLMEEAKKEREALSQEVSLGRP